MLLSLIGPKWCWPIRLQDFKSNISLEQSDEIVYFCVFKSWEKNIGMSVVRNGCNGCAHWSQGQWMKWWMKWAEFLHTDANSAELITLKGCGQKYAWDSNFWMDGWIQLIFYMLIIFREAKSYFNSCWVSLIKYGLLGHGTL